MYDESPAIEHMNRLARVWSDHRESWMLLRVQATKEVTSNGCILFTLKHVEEIK
ncbi:MAG: hypothetical protein R2729_22970 [Bryobacteraceae bacterium]